MPTGVGEADWMRSIGRGSRIHGLLSMGWVAEMVGCAGGEAEDSPPCGYRQPVLARRRMASQAPKRPAASRTSESQGALCCAVLVPEPVWGSSLAVEPAA